MSKYRFIASHPCLIAGEIKELSCLAKLPLAEGEEEPAPPAEDEGEEGLAAPPASALGKDLNGGPVVKVTYPLHSLPHLSPCFSLLFCVDSNRLTAQYTCVKLF